MVFTRFPGRIDSRTRSRMDTSENSMSPEPNVFGGGGITDLVSSRKTLSALEDKLAMYIQLTVYIVLEHAK